MIIITRQIGQAKAKETQADLNSILHEWQWENKPCPTAQDFLTKMKPWVQGRIKEQQERKEFLKKFNLKNLSQIKEVKA